MSEPQSEIQPPCWHGPECSGTGPDCAPDKPPFSPAEAFWNEAHPPGHEMGWQEVLDTPTLHTLAEVYLLRAEVWLSTGEVPPRWKWCPECNGIGVGCGVCKDVPGIVPATHSGSTPPP